MVLKTHVKLCATTPIFFKKKAEKRLKLKYSSMIFECASSTEQWPFRSWEKSSVCYIQDELMNLAIFLDADSDAAILG